MVRRPMHLHVTGQQLNLRRRVLNPCRNSETELLPGEARLGELVHGSVGTTLLGAQCRLHSCTRFLHLTDFESANRCMVHLRRKQLDGILVPRARVRPR